MDDKQRQRTRFFRFYNRILQRCSNLVFRPILKTAPVAVNSCARVVLYTVLDKRNCRAYLLAAKSFLRYESNVRVVVQDDGTLDAACRHELATHLPGMELLGRDETLRSIRAHAGPTLAAALPDLERCHFFLPLKLLNVVLRFRGQDVILLDSDLLFLREPTFVLDWIRDGAGWCFYSDGGNALATTFRRLGFAPGPVDVGEFNAGFLGFHNDVCEDELAAVLRKVAEYDPRLFTHWEIEQAVWAVLFNGFANPINLDTVQPEYVGSGWFSCDVLERTAVLVHFVGSIRFKNLRYVRLAHKVIRELKETARFAFRETQAVGC